MSQIQYSQTAVSHDDDPTLAEVTVYAGDDRIHLNTEDTVGGCTHLALTAEETEALIGQLSEALRIALANR